MEQFTAEEERKIREAFNTLGRALRYSGEDYEKLKEMELKMVLKKVGEYFGSGEGEEAIDEAIKFLKENRDHVALLRLRHKAEFLPEIGCNCEPRDNSEWVLIDMYDKQDTGIYGSVFYF